MARVGRQGRMTGIEGSVLQVRNRARFVEPAPLPNRPVTGPNGEVELALLRSDIIERDEHRRATIKFSQTYVGLPVIPKPEPWQKFAACRDMDPAVFFTVGRPNRQAVKACLACTVREPCLEQALIEDAENKDSFGYRGGETPSGRKKLRTYANSKLARTRAKNEEIRRKFAEQHKPTARRDLIIAALADQYKMSQGSVKRLVNDLA